MNLSYFVRFLKSIEISVEGAMIFQGFLTNQSRGDNLFELSVLEGKILMKSMDFAKFEILD